MPEQRAGLGRNARAASAARYGRNDKKETY